MVLIFKLTLTIKNISNIFFIHFFSATLFSQSSHDIVEVLALMRLTWQIITLNFLHDEIKEWRKDF